MGERGAEAGVVPGGRRRPVGWWALLLLPAAWILMAGDRAMAPFSVDLTGHLWVAWSVAQGEWFRTHLLAWPQGVDLLPILGGWLDLWLVAALSRLLPLLVSYNIVNGVFLVVAGLGGLALALALGAGGRGALVAGLLLQLDGFVLFHLKQGRPEQVGLGFMALALAATLGSWKARVSPWLAAPAWTLLLMVSWELALTAALVVALVGPFALAGPAPPGALRRLAITACSSILLAAPWAALFLYRAAQVRSLHEGDFSLAVAQDASVGLLGWLAPGEVRPSTLAMLTLLALPFTTPRGDRRLWFGIAFLLLASYALALGPYPGLWRPGDGTGTPWGPFNLLHRAPVLAWFHWPDRLLAPLSLAAAVSAALAVGWLRARARGWGLALAAGLLLGALGESAQADRLPRPTFALEQPPAMGELGRHPTPGAVLDLPIMPNASVHVRYQLGQLAHGRPIMFHMFHSHLVSGDLKRRVERDPLLSWFHSLMLPDPPPQARFGPGDIERLQQDGYSFVALHSFGWPKERWAMGRQALSASFGEPLFSHGDDWLCWLLEEPSGPEGPVTRPPSTGVRPPPR